MHHNDDGANHYQCVRTTTEPITTNASERRRSQPQCVRIPTEPTTRRQNTDGANDNECVRTPTEPSNIRQNTEGSHYRPIRMAVSTLSTASCILRPSSSNALVACLKIFSACDIVNNAECMTADNSCKSRCPCWCVLGTITDASVGRGLSTPDDAEEVFCLFC